MAINIIEKFKTADTADKLRSITTEQIRAAFNDEKMTTVRAENLQRQLLRLADEKELEELKTALPTEEIKSAFPDAVIETKRKRKYPCILLWVKGKPEEVVGDES